MLPGLSLVLLSLGMLALFLDLEHKLYVWRLYTTFQIASPMSWGAWILLLVYPALRRVVRAPAAGAPPRALAGARPAVRAARGEPRGRAAIAASAIVLGVALGIYTGVLLSALGARPLWNSAILGPLFLVSGLSSAAAFTHLVARHRGGARAAGEERQRVPGRRAVRASALFLVGLLSASQAHVAGGAAGARRPVHGGVLGARRRARDRRAARSSSCWR